MATHMDAHSAHYGLPQGRPAQDAMGSMLEELSGHIQARIAEVEHRHAEAMQVLQDKLERMSGTAGKARPAMPSELAAAFGRIESGMADLVERIADTAPDRRRGADAFVFGAAKAGSSHFVFDPPKRVPVAPVSISTADATHAEPWDRDAAEALAHLYESGEGLLVKHLPEAALFAPAQWNRSSAEADRANTSSRQAVPQVASLPGVVSGGLGDDKEWLDERLAHIADRVSKSIGDARPDGALKTLMSRVDELESRFTDALGGIATKSDVAKMRTDGLQQVEAQIKALAGHIEQSQQQLTRLDAIEQHLSDLTAFAHASMDQETGPATHPAEAVAPVDFAQLADMAVERALAHMPPASANPAAPAETQARVDAVHAMLQDFAAERRRGDQYTTGMLETVQEALIRLIDRVDAIDGKQLHAAPLPADASMAAHVGRQGIAEHPGLATESSPRLGADAEADPETIAPPKSGADGEKRFQRRRGMRGGGGSAAEAAGIAEDLAEPPAQPEIDIKELRFNARSIRAQAPPAAADANAATDEPEAKSAKSRGVRADAAKTVAAGSGLAKRGVFVAATAIGLVGIGFIAQHYLFPADGSSPVGTINGVSAAPAVSRPVANSGVAITPVTQAPKRAIVPPGMMEPAQRPDVAAQPSVTIVPPKQRSEAGQRLQGSIPEALVAPGKPRGPASVPETVNEDLSMTDPVAGDDAVAPASTAVNPYPIQTPHGVAVAGTAVEASPRTVVDAGAIQRHLSQAATSERLGLAARPASDFSRRFGAVTPATASIVTGSTSAAPAGPSEASVGEAPMDAADLPPAMVGPLSLRLAAAKGHPSAAFEVATRLAEGRGIKQDFKQAIVWYQRAANKGLAIAQYRLGTLYERGLGTPVDVAHAKLWYKRAADLGNVKAMHNMAVLSAGNAPAGPDYVTAAKWFKLAADYGLSDSQFNLGVLYENGLGVAKEPRTAYLWYALAARNGDAEAVRRRDQLLATLDAETLSSVNEQVKIWHARPINTSVNDARVAGDQWRNHAVNTPVTAAAIPEMPPAAPLASAESAAPAPRTIRAPLKR